MLQDICDNELRTLLQVIRTEIPHLGEVLVMGHLHSLGYAISRQRVRNAIHAMDPLNTALRLQGILTTRRPYSVAFGRRDAPESVLNCTCILRSEQTELSVVKRKKRTKLISTHISNELA